MPTMTNDHIDVDIIGGIDYLFADDTLTLRLGVVRTTPTEEKDSEITYSMQYFTRDQHGNEYEAGELFTDVFEPKHWLEAYLVEAEQRGYPVNQSTQQMLIRAIRGFREDDLQDVEAEAIAIEMELVLAPACDELDGSIIKLSTGEAFEGDGVEHSAELNEDEQLPLVYTDYYTIITVFPRFVG